MLLTPQIHEKPAQKLAFAAFSKARVEARVAELLAEARAALEAMGLREGSRGKQWLAGAVRALGERSA